MAQPPLTSASPPERTACWRVAIRPGPLPHLGGRLQDRHRRGATLGRVGTQGAHLPAWGGAAPFTHTLHPHPSQGLPEEAGAWHMPTSLRLLTLPRCGVGQPRGPAGSCGRLQGLWVQNSGQDADLAEGRWAALRTRKKAGAKVNGFSPFPPQNLHPRRKLSCYSHLGLEKNFQKRTLRYKILNLEDFTPCKYTSFFWK